MRHGQAVVLEDLNGLRNSINNKPSTMTWKLSLFAYRRLQNAIISKAIEHNVPVLFVDPRNTSSICPRCGGRLTYTHRLGYCQKCGFIADRDVVGAMNILTQALAYVGVPGSPPNAPPMNNEARGRGRNRNEGMKVIKCVPD
jgi:putative transposase